LLKGFAFFLSEWTTETVMKTSVNMRERKDAVLVYEGFAVALERLPDFLCILTHDLIRELVGWTTRG
jgi:hypothetical protein